MVRWTIRKNYWRKVSADFSTIWKNSITSFTQGFQTDLPVTSNTETIEDAKDKALVEKENDIRKFVRRVSLSKHTQKLISELKTDVKLLRLLPSISKVKSYTSHEGPAEPNHVISSSIERVEELASLMTKQPEAVVMAIRNEAPSIISAIENEYSRVLSSDQISLTDTAPTMSPSIKSKRLTATCKVLMGENALRRGRYGVRILALDGGGTRGLVSLQVLKEIQRLSGGRPIHELFDYVIGVSTGAILAFMIGALKMPLHEIESKYKELSKVVFSTNYFQASKRLVTSQSFYDSDEYEKVLQKIFGDTLLLESSIDSKGPRVACVSTLVNRSRIKPYVWRNYNLVFGKNMEQIHFHGTINSEIWKAIRCSSAAPGYFGEVVINKSYDVSSPTKNTVDIHQDGGILVNNPSALALSECSALWPKHKVQCLVSIGTGRFEPNRSDRGLRKNTSLMEKVSFIIDSATNVANVHSLMFETMPEYTYFRFNPYLMEKIDLDAWRPQEIEAMERSSLQYCKLNENKLKHCAKKLEKLSDLQKMIRTYL